MSKIKDNILRLLNQIFRRNSQPMIANVTKQNYDEYHKTYDTLSKVFSKLNEIDAYLVGGISAPIQTNNDLYRQNEDLDILCKEDQLLKLIDVLQNSGYTVDDKRGIKTESIVDSSGKLHAMNHELDASTGNEKLLGIGIFTYSVKDNDVIMHSYAFHEKEGRVIGVEKKIPKELFDLMYDKNVVDYKGINLKTQSKEYTYVTKSRGTREKDKIDASVIEPSLDEESMKKIERIRELEAKVKRTNLLYDKDGKIEARQKAPSLEDKVNLYLTSLYLKSSSIDTEQIVNDVLQSEKYEEVVKEHPEINALIKGWQEKNKNITYRDKIKLITEDYSKRLQRFDRQSIDNALAFLHRRYQNHGKNNNDIELSTEAQKIFELMNEYGQSIKSIFVDNGIDITHITSVAPEKLEGGVLRKSIDRANNYETDRVDAVFAASTPIDGTNPYIARNGSGMIILGKSTYIYGNDSIDITQDQEGKKHAVLKQPNYIYSINPEEFNPVCNLTINKNSNKPVFEFSEEWISDREIDVSDKSQVRGVQKVQDVTSLLEHYTVLCDVKSDGVGIKVRQCKTKDDALEYIETCIKDGSVRNINKEARINVKDLSTIER